jgi:hypothetical protein
VKYVKSASVHSLQLRSNAAWTPDCLDLVQDLVEIRYIILTAIDTDTYH